MRIRPVWIIAIGALILAAAAAGTALAGVEPQAISHSDADDTFHFRVRIVNSAADNEPPTLFSPGVWTLHSQAGPLFIRGEADRGEGLESLAEDGDPLSLAESLRARGLMAGLFDTAVCGDGPGPLPPDYAYEFVVTATPETPLLSFAFMLLQSNDLFLAPDEKGIALFDAGGTPIGHQDVTPALRLWDAGTEANEAPGGGPNQAPRQRAPNSGPPDGDPSVRPVDDGFSYPEITDLVKVYIVPVPTVERGGEQEPRPRADAEIGDMLQVGNVRWRALSAEYLGHEIKKVKDASDDILTTDERFVLVRFWFKNAGSDPLEFDGGQRNRTGTPLRDGQGREFTYYRKHRAARPDDPPHDYVPESENCYGRWTWRGWRPFVLKPNAPTTCSVIYEVSVDSTDLALAASDLVKEGDSRSAAISLGLPPIESRPIGRDVQVGAVRWRVDSAKNLGHTLESGGEKTKTADRFLRVRFLLLNKGSEALRLKAEDDVVLRDRQGREHRHFRVRRTGWPDRYPDEFIPDHEECADIEILPNTLTACAAIYEVPDDATGLMLIATDLGGQEEGGAEMIELGLSSRLPLPFYSIGEDVEVGDVCWRALEVEGRGQTVSDENGDIETTDGRFIAVDVRFLNKGSGELQFDSQQLEALSEGGRYVPVQSECIADGESLSESFSVPPNAPTTCELIYDVASGIESLLFRATDMEGYEAVPITLQISPSPTPGGHVILEAPNEIAPGIYRGEAPAGAYCYWARLNSVDDGGSVLALGLREGPFYVEILESDAGIEIDGCVLVDGDPLTPLEKVAHPDPPLRSVAPGMYLVKSDIAPGRYRGEAEQDQFCFWQRLSCVTGAEDCSIAWELEGQEYVVEVEASDVAVEFGCPVEKVE